ncbi:MAG: hypothetical protein EOM25_08465 [Deltaproteobacteria bacterium]|nr:hypothetical protein [Deltaproteobacteria bacterium]
MGFLSGSLGLTRYRIVEPVPDSFWSQALDKLKHRSFRDIDQGVEERSFGWVCFDDILDSNWKTAPPEKGEYLAFCLRLDTRRVPAAVFKKHFQLALRELQSRMREQGQKFVTKDQKTELKESVALRLRSRTLPIPAYFEVVWSIRRSEVYLASTRDSVRALFEELFEISFGLHLEMQTPYFLALTRMGERKKILDDMEPTSLVL